MIARVLMCYGAAWSVLLLLASASAPPSGQGGRTAYAWVSGDAAVQAAAEAQLRNRTWDFIDGVRGFCGIGWHRAAPGAPRAMPPQPPREMTPRMS